MVRWSKWSELSELKKRHPVCNKLKCADAAMGSGLSKPGKSRPGAAAGKSVVVHGGLHGGHELKTPGGKATYDNKVAQESLLRRREQHQKVSRMLTEHINSKQLTAAFPATVAMPAYVALCSA